MRTFLTCAFFGICHLLASLQRPFLVIVALFRSSLMSFLGVSPKLNDFFCAFQVFCQFLLLLSVPFEGLVELELILRILSLLSMLSLSSLASCKPKHTFDRQIEA